MATYIQGVTDYIPEIQPFKPDLQLYATALQTMQAKYDTNYKQLSEYWGAVLKSPMSREDNIKRRDEFLKAIDSEIKKISGMDLSLRQNVDQAMKVLDPIVNDKYIVNDILKTKMYNQQVDYGQTLRGTEKGWDGGLQALQYWLEDFKKVDADDALSFKTPSYVEKVNLYQMAMEDAQKNKFVVKADNFSKDGSWIVTNQNGDLIASNLRDYMIGRFGSDANVMRFMETQAYVERKNYITTNRERFGGNDAQAQMAFAQGKLNEIVADINKTNIDAEDKKKLIDSYMDAYADYVANNGVLPSDKGVIGQATSLQQAQQNAANTQAVTSNYSKTMKLYMADYMDFLSNGERLDQVVGVGNLYDTLGKAAKGYASLTEERLIKDHNPYKLEQIRSANDLSNALAIEDRRFQHDMIKMETEINLKDKAERERLGLDAKNNLTMISDYPGASTGMVTSGVQENINRNRTLHTDATMMKADFLSQVGQNMMRSYDEAVAKGDTRTQQIIKGALDNIYRPLGVKTEDMLDSTKRAKTLANIAKMDYRTAPSLYKSYNIMLDQLDQNKAAYNDSWAKSVRSMPNYSTIQENIRIQDLAIKDFDRTRMDQLKTVIIPHFQQKGNDRTNILASILGESVNGFFPDDYRKDAIIEKLAKHQDDLAKREGRTNFYTKDYYKKNWNEAKKVWNESYSKIPNIQAWNHFDGLGPNSNAMAGKAANGKFNYAYRSKNSTTNLFDQVLTDAEVALNSLPVTEDNTSGALLVGYGNNGDQLENSDPEAVAELKALIATKDVYNDPKDEKVFAGSWTYANISQGNDKYIGLTFTPSQLFVESFKKDKDVGRLITGKTITMRIPKEYARNMLYQQSTTSSVEHLYENTNSVDIKMPSGTAIINKTPYGPVVDYNLKIWNSKTKSYDVESFQQPYSQGIEINDVYDKYKIVFEKLNQMNQINIANDRMVYGVKDISQLLQQSSGK